MLDNFITLNPGNLKIDVESALVEMEADQILNRIWKLDHTVWKPDPEEITNRMGWLWIARHMKRNLNRISKLVDSVLSDGYQNVVLFGMGGSSLAAEVFKNIFGVKEGYLSITVLDSTAPGTVQAITRRVAIKKTLFIVSTKSGSTAETLSFFKYFYNLTIQQLGEKEAGSHFIAITDPGSKLEKIAKENKFREIFLNDPNIGGRYSALSFFGLVPAALIGVDIGLILERAIAMTRFDDIAARLGTILGLAAIAGRDKLTFIITESLNSFGNWVEQLIAESSGKEGKGILPVVSEPLGDPGVYGEDRLFIHIKLGDHSELNQGIHRLMESGHPVVDVQLSDIYDLGGQFFLWELATAITCYHLRVNPFDQPNVESAKVQAREMVAEYQELGKLPEGGNANLDPENLRNFLTDTKAGDYIALQAYIQPTEQNIKALQNLRLHLRNQYKLATTLGFGPRFLHSTGQLHKGDAGNGFFIQFVTQPDQDLAIPDEAGEPGSSITFGILILAQALGDGQALINENRHFIRFKLNAGETAKNIASLS